MGIALANAAAQFTTPVELIPVDTYTTTETGTGKDVSMYEGQMLAILHSREGDGGSLEVLDVILESSDAVGGTYAAIPGAVFTQVDDTAGGSIQTLAFDANAAGAFVRAVGTPGGTTPSFVFGVSIVGVLKSS